MPTSKRRSPYLWVTWVTKIVSGDQSCEWATWFRANYEGYTKREDDNRDQLAEWNIRHTSLLQKRADELRSEGYTVYLEDENKFTMKGATITLQGKPDIVAIKDDDYLVVDCKGGKKRNSDHVQVLIYMLFLPMTHPACLGKAVRGEIEYLDDRVELGAIPTASKKAIVDAIARMGSPNPAPIAPSFHECRFCDLTKADCSKRVDRETPVTKTALF